MAIFTSLYCQGSDPLPELYALTRRECGTNTEIHHTGPSRYYYLGYKICVVNNQTLPTNYIQIQLNVTYTTLPDYMESRTERESFEIVRSQRKISHE